MATTDSATFAHDSSGTPEKRVQSRVLLAAILGAGLVFLDSSVANVALPAIQAELGLTTAAQQWVASAYLLSLSVLLLVGGRLADLFGRKRLFVIGLGAYAAIATSAALAPSGGFLIAARALQGVAGALLVPTTLALINANFPASERGRAIGTWAAWSGITTILGPVLGGLAIDYLSWRFAFLITPLLAVVALVSARPVPESVDEDADHRLDYAGVLLVVAAVGGVVFALIQGPVVGFGNSAVIVPGLVGIVLLAAFAWWETRIDNPVMPYAMFANRNLAVANLVTLFVYAGLYGVSFYITLYVQTALGVSATLAGSVFIPITILLFFLSPIAGRLNDRFGPRWLMFAGPLLASVGIGIAGLTGPGEVWTLLVPGVVVFGIGLGFTVAPVTATAIGSAPERFSGVASGFNNAVSRVAGLLAIALMGVVVVQLWQASLDARTVPGTAAGSALGSVADTAFVSPDTRGLPAEEAREVARLAAVAAEDAFRNGMLLAAALVAAGGVTSAIGIRGGGIDRDDG